MLSTPTSPGVPQLQEHIRQLIPELLPLEYTEADQIKECLKRDTDLTSIINQFLQHADIESTEQLLDRAKQEIKVFPFSKVKVCWLRLLVDCCVVKGLRNIQEHLDLFEDERNNSSRIPPSSEWMDEVVDTLDYALIVGGGIGREKLTEELLDLLSQLDASYESLAELPQVHHQIQNSIISSKASNVPKILHSVQTLNQPSLTTFEKHMNETRKPILLKGILAHWPALDKWDKQQFWLDSTINGRRIIPVEIGRSYLDDDWRQELIPFKTFLDKFITNVEDDMAEIGYLAQHDLLKQIPGLRQDIMVPDYCYSDAPEPEKGTPVALMKIKKKEEQKSQINGKNMIAEMKTSHPNILSLLSEGKPEIKTQSQQQSTFKSQQMHTTTSKEDFTRQELEVKLLDNSKSVKSSQQLEEDGHDRKRRKVEAHNGDGNQALENDDEEEEDIESPEIHQNIWFGGRTISPLHHDPYHNILCQVVGTKYIRLYSPHQSSRLYPRSMNTEPPHLKNLEELEEKVPDQHSQSKRNDFADNASNQTIDWSNNSWMDVAAMEFSPAEDWDAVYPGISSVPYLECILEPGQALYIPVGWWHYVRSCSVCISVSFWW